MCTVGASRWSETKGPWLDDRPLASATALHPPEKRQPRAPVQRSRNGTNPFISRPDSVATALERKAATIAALPLQA
jgi:hypothetical protein